MTELSDLVSECVQLVLTGHDPKLFALLGQMTPQEVQQVQATLIAEYIKTLPPPPNASAPPDATKLDFVGLCIEIVRRGARPDDPRLSAMLRLMTDDERERGRKALGELWLAQLITGPPN
jgi:hypothetical protein